jgi:hypothetical protein
MRTLSRRVLLLVFGILLRSVTPSQAVLYEVSWVDVRFEPTYDHIPPQFLAGHAAGVVPVTINGSLEWDSETRQMVAGFNPIIVCDISGCAPNISGPERVFDSGWVITGMNRPLLSDWDYRGGTYALNGEAGFGGIIQFLRLSAPSTFPDFAVGVYDATTVPNNLVDIVFNSGLLFTPVSGEIRVVAVPEPACVMVLGAIQFVGLWWMMNRRARPDAPTAPSRSSN